MYYWILRHHRPSLEPGVSYGPTLRARIRLPDWCRSATTTTGTGNCPAPSGHRSAPCACEPEPEHGFAARASIAPPSVHIASSRTRPPRRKSQGAGGYALQDVPHDRTQCISVVHLVTTLEDVKRVTSPAALYSIFNGIRGQPSALLCCIESAY